MTPSAAPIRASAAIALPSRVARRRAARPAARRGSLRHAGNRHARHRPCRLRRILRHHREARRSLARRQAADRRRRNPRRGLDRLLYRAHFRRAFGHADVQGTTALPARDRHPPEHVEIRRGREAGARAHARSDAAGRAGIDRRGVPRSVRHRATAWPQRRPIARALCGRRRARRSASRCRSGCPTTSFSPRSPPTSTSRAALPCSAAPMRPEFLAGKPVSIIFGIGRVAQERLARDGYRTIADLQKADERDLMRAYGVEGQRLCAACARHRPSQGRAGSRRQERVGRDHLRHRYRSAAAARKNPLGPERKGLRAAEGQSDLRHRR